MSGKNQTTCAVHETLHNQLDEKLKPLAHIPTMRVQLNFIIAGIGIVVALVGAPLAEHFLKPHFGTAAPALVFQAPPLHLERTK